MPHTSKLYVFEIASVLAAALLLIADCRHMMMDLDLPSAPEWATLQRTPDVKSLLSAEDARIEQADVIARLNGLSTLMAAGAARPLGIVQ